MATWKERTDSWLDNEVATELVLSMIGMNNAIRNREKLKENPNLELLDKIQEENKELWKERKELSSSPDSTAIIKKAFEVYGPILKEYKKSIEE